MSIFVCTHEYGNSNIVFVKVLKSSIELQGQSSFSLTAHKHSTEVFKKMCKISIDGFRDLDRTHSLILTLYFHMHHVKFHLMKSSKRCLDTLYFESPFEFSQWKFSILVKMRISIMFSFHTYCFSDPTVAITPFLLFIFLQS